MTRTFVQGEGVYFFSFWGAAFVREFWSFTWTSSSSRALVCCQGCSIWLLPSFSFFPFLSLSLLLLGIYFCDYPDCLRTLLLFHSFGFGFSFVIAHRQRKEGGGRREGTVNRTKDESENKTKYFSKDFERGRERGIVCWDSKWLRVVPYAARCRFTDKRKNL